MRTLRTPPALAGAPGLLGRQWQVQLKRFARLVAGRSELLARRFEGRLRRRGMEARQRKALLAITPGAAARLLARGRAIEVFLEEVDYHGRRLAKLNLPPSAVLEVLADFDGLLAAEIRRVAPEESAALELIGQQLSAGIAITLNNAFYQVREAETQAFYELGRAELDSINQTGLLIRCEEILTRYCQAQAGRIVMLEGRSVAPGGAARPLKELSQARYIVRGRRSERWLLEPGWRGRYESCWSIPLLAQGWLAGVMQFGFSKPYEWLPRESQLLAAAGERCLLASEKARLVEDLAVRQEQVQRLAGHMLQVEEAERRRIGRELHDEAGQLLLYLRLQLEMLERLVPANLGELRRGLKGARELLQQAIREIRRLLADLSPVVLEQLGLPAAVRQLANRFRRLHPIRMRLDLAPVGMLPPAAETTIYRLVQECLSNVARHSHATTVRVSLRRDDRTLKLRIKDNGAGFDVEEALRGGNSFGLAGMRERVALLNGICELDSHPGQGATISVQLPIPGPVPVDKS